MDNKENGKDKVITAVVVIVLICVFAWSIFSLGTALAV